MVSQETVGAHGKQAWACLFLAAAHSWALLSRPRLQQSSPRPASPGLSKSLSGEHSWSGEWTVRSRDNPTAQWLLICSRWLLNATNAFSCAPPSGRWCRCTWGPLVYVEEAWGDGPGCLGKLTINLPGENRRWGGWLQAEAFFTRGTAGGIIERRAFLFSSQGDPSQRVCTSRLETRKMSMSSLSPKLVNSADAYPFPPCPQWILCPVSTSSLLSPPPAPSHLVEGGGAGVCIRLLGSHVSLLWSCRSQPPFSADPPVCSGPSQAQGRRNQATQAT